MSQSELSVIIPAGPGERAWASLVSRIPPDWPMLITAVDARPRHLPEHIQWLHGRPGRGRQLNAGAAAVSSHWLWFVHADSQLDPSSFSAVRAWCAQRGQGLGYLDLGFLPDGPRLTRLNALGANLRSRWFGLPYGDQAFCVSAREFHALGGFRQDLQRGEDLDFVVRARAAGLPATRIGGRILTSARRYREHGWWRTTWQHQLNARRLIRQARSSPPAGPAP